MCVMLELSERNQRGYVVPPTKVKTAEGSFIRPLHCKHCILGIKNIQMFTVWLKQLYYNKYYTPNGLHVVTYRYLLNPQYTYQSCFYTLVWKYNVTVSDHEVSKV